MLASRLRLPPSLARQWHAQRHTVAAFSPGRVSKSAEPLSSRSLYERVFPSKPASVSAQARRPRASQPLSKLGDQRQYLPASGGRDSEDSGHDEDIDLSKARDELSGWLNPSGLAAADKQHRTDDRDGNENGDHQGGDSQIVLVLQNLSRSLVESDFHRFARRGQHIAGWTGGITKVVRSICPVTGEPRGQYYVVFDSQRAAAAYVDAVQTRLRQAQEVGVPSSSSTTSSSQPIPAASHPTTTTTTHFTLLPPDLPFQAARLSLNDLADVADAGSRQQQQGGTAAALAQDSVLPRMLQDELLGRSEADLGRRVLVRLAGSKVTWETMKEFIRADGAERNLPWRLAASRPVRTIRAGSGPIRWWGEEEDGLRELVAEGTNKKKEEEIGYTRFVVVFADAAEARRFARTWHRREVVDERTDRVMVVNARALW
ncbi:uncharacterized protein B0T15DRAFT_529200 [Chaetomium strumarium]|uniref:Uncharacterized protein n=1 Tax=Chaetomium strumarium TaxID=1170767 RepID=A0AAJ0GVX2_9PEZI|nr:hypothetical protein B0T15DRAFT_529200 [Chaetomium strumarium]